MYLGLIKSGHNPIIYRNALCFSIAGGYNAVLSEKLELHLWLDDGEVIEQLHPIELCDNESNKSRYLKEGLIAFYVDGKCFKWTAKNGMEEWK